MRTRKELQARAVWFTKQNIDDGFDQFEAAYIFLIAAAGAVKAMGGDAKATNCVVNTLAAIAADVIEPPRWR